MEKDEMSGDLALDVLESLMISCQRLGQNDGRCFFSP